MPRMRYIILFCIIIHIFTLNSLETVFSFAEFCFSLIAILQALLRLVERLKDQIDEGRQKNLTLERDIRKSVTETFSKIISDMENSWK